MKDIAMLGRFDMVRTILISVVFTKAFIPLTTMPQGAPNSASHLDSFATVVCERPQSGRKCRGSTKERNAELAHSYLLHWEAKRKRRCIEEQHCHRLTSTDQAVLPPPRHPPPPHPPPTFSTPNHLPPVYPDPLPSNLPSTLGQIYVQKQEENGGCSQLWGNCSHLSSLPLPNH